MIAGHGHRHTADGGAVLLDVGGEVGALVLIADESARGLEIEISRLDVTSGMRQHVAVHPRFLGERIVHAAVYPDLVEGDYLLWGPDGDPIVSATVVGGAVCEVVWTR
jgi:hypothetical protein